ncbi:hypothetical protein RM572_08625 [Streptomyces sp. DSM 42041]|uniref:Uncharacterized protein n=1 Tax=Streptomyces hazeniae TaxID=3075538 RepID=A0ABU2NPE6_9ACTN|nr:hypothetical protein [Streptomyces sp. DSM 42041]MDT0378838.1 hypothetical protein [Streptomyces sp. DSM 42041]
MYRSQEPPHATAFAHPETRAAWEGTRNRIRVRFLLWSLLFVGLFALSVVLNATAETDYVKRGSNQLGPAIGGLALLWYVFVLYSCLGALSRVKKARKVLEVCPWRQVAVRKAPGGKDGTGVTVQIGLSGGTPPASGDESAWSPTMAARDPRRYNRWDPQLEQGAWFAGEPGVYGVLALPGGAGPMNAQRSQANLSGERTTPGRDLESVLRGAARS